MNCKTINTLIQLKNASILYKNFVVLIPNKFSLQIIIILYEKGLLQSFTFNGNKKLKIFLRYYINNNVLNDFKIFSKPSNLKRIRLNTLFRLTSKQKNVFCSTDCGILTLRECKSRSVGGVALFIC